MQASLQTMVGKRPVGRFCTHMERRHAQGPDTTSLYPANTGHGKVVGQRFKGRGLVVERGEKSIFEVSAQALSKKCPARMTYYPKEAS